MSISLNNTTGIPQTCNVITEIIDPLGSVVGRMVDEECFSKEGLSVIHQKLSLNKPQLWDVHKPQLYRQSLQSFIRVKSLISILLPSVFAP
ncbi:hypothetical protein [Saccharicrinis fermentans]|uniref:hypothetical protein n=1 Tax=Saccharicrinis fermentans TaxID=982 RepID=UPI0004B85DF5|nr:hypothetical protein [Saccharicrinis fermentans]